MTTNVYIYDEDGNVARGENPNTVLVFNNEDGVVYEMSEEDSNQLLNIHGNANEEQNNENNGVDPSPSCERNVWSEEDTLSLIAEYKAHEGKFKSTTIRNVTVWQQIAAKLKTHTALQCENRFKYLKSQYIKKLESMGPRNTGGTFVKFPYFEQFDEIFGRQPNIHPVALASSSQPSTSTIQEKKKKLDDEEDDDCSSDELKPKKKKTSLQKQLEVMEKRSDNREAAREQRHKENLQQRDEALQIFRTFCSNITDILKKNNNNN